MYILGIESSCDETAASVSENGTKIISSVISSQVDEHKKYGGVVPEIASRRHCENILGVTKAALEQAELTMSDIDAVAVTYAPGLIGALLVGVPCKAVIMTVTMVISQKAEIKTAEGSSGTTAVYPRHSRSCVGDICYPIFILIHVACAVHNIKAMESV